MHEEVSICTKPSKEERGFIESQLALHGLHATGGKMHFPGTDDPGLALELAIRGPSGQVVGAVTTCSVLGVMWLDVLYIFDEFRRRGLASWLVLEAERIAHEKGCVGAGTWTFNWQGPQFYPTIGYRVCGIYDGYPFGVTEHVLAKRLPDGVSTQAAAELVARHEKDGFALVAAPTEDDMRGVYRGFHEFCVRNAGEEMDYPSVSLSLVLKDAEGRLVGGLTAFPTIRNMVLEAIWVDEGYRGKGHGRRLLLEAERIAKDSGCCAVSTHALSFQSPGFFHRLGYATYGTVGVAVDGHTEDLLIKRL